MAITVPAYVARTQLGALLREAAKKKRRFIITRGGVPTAVLLSVSDFDDMVEELDSEFQKSLALAAEEYRSGQAMSLRDYLKSRMGRRRARRAKTS